ncbi:MAG: polysaccharide biosynthesis C-terminal domain-containing protein, partial [Muribaculaceae bacterium]|nr:polysaccharide biosynthesis C-terminal domain-containing protein [Muribaculaceae bacterium]
IMRATGYPRKAMVSALLSVVVNLILAPIFIFVLDKGIAGAAMATVCGQTAAFIWVLSHFMSKKSFVHFKRDNSWFKWSIMSKIYAIGMSPFLMNICACVVVVFINKALLESGGADGNLAIGAYGILNRVTMFFVMIVFGVTQGMQPILGFNYGAGNWQRVTKTLKTGIFIGVAITTVGWILTQTIPSTLSGLFTSDKQLIDLATSGFHIYFLIYPLVGCQIVIQNFFQSIGKPQLSIFLSLTRQLLFLLPFLLILPKMYGIPGVWASMAGSDFIAFVIAVITAIIMMRRYGKKFKNQSSNNGTPVRQSAS